MRNNQEVQVAASTYRALLSLFAGLFLLRVLAQLAVKERPTAFLPSFDQWHSATMPYWTLLCVQIAILLAMAIVIARLPEMPPRPATGTLLTVVASVYAAAMAVRLIVGALRLSSSSWFDGAVSTAFHFVLAAFLLVLGLALGRPGERARLSVMVANGARYAAYPLVMAGGYALFVWLRETGSPLLFSSYLSVLVAGIGILLHETFVPVREGWRPSRADVANDSLFLLIVQVGVPVALKALSLLVILHLAQWRAAPMASLWPHDAPVLLQVVLMLVVAEFFRYWIHRALHVIGPLWQLHAVHHAADKLYTLNVGRFHPFDKALQFLGDTLPFLLLGVAPEVFAAYFVIYAINGFYQHSNADVRLGVFNWIIAGPELHRWHHSTRLAEAQSNYGNNLIVWDVVFGTRFFPPGRLVDRVGIGNRDWPHGFAAQLSAPFTTATDARRD